MGVLDSKVVLITGAARGQGRSHALRCAEEGADIIAIDVCRNMDVLPYPLATSEELAQTVADVEALGQKIVSFEVDVRDLDRLTRAVSDAVSVLGRLDIVVANASIAPCPPSENDPAKIWRDVLDVNLTGVWNTVQATRDHLVRGGRGGSIVMINSTAGLKALPLGTVGGGAYGVAKHGVVGLMRVTAQELAPHMIRVNTIHPTGVGTPMVVNDPMQEYIGANPGVVDSLTNLMPVEMVEPVDISNAVVWLGSDAARYVTGVTLPVDAGFLGR